jgi:hypothetical protein
MQTLKSFHHSDRNKYEANPKPRIISLLLRTFLVFFMFSWLTMLSSCFGIWHSHRDDRHEVRNERHDRDDHHEHDEHHDNDDHHN